MELEPAPESPMMTSCQTPPTSTAHKRTAADEHITQVFRTLKEALQLSALSDAEYTVRRTQVMQDINRLPKSIASLRLFTALRNEGLLLHEEFTILKDGVLDQLIEPPVAHKQPPSAAADVSHIDPNGKRSQAVLMRSKSMTPFEDKENIDIAHRHQHQQQQGKTVPKGPSRTFTGNVLSPVINGVPKAPSLSNGPQSVHRSQATVTSHHAPLKLLIVGNSKCGKTSLIKRFTTDLFNDEYVTTIGADFAKKVLPINENLSVRLHLWDIAGQDRFANLTRAYFKDAVGAVVVCDVTREATQEDAVKIWKTEIDEKVRLPNGRCIPVVLVANKCDLLESGTASFIAGAKMAEKSKELGFAGWFVTSAKENRDVEPAIRFLVGKILENGVAAEEDKDGRSANRIQGFKLTDTDTIFLHPKETANGCC